MPMFVGGRASRVEWVRFCRCADCSGWHATRPAFQCQSRILKRMNAAVAIVLLAAPFAILAALVAVLIVYLGNRTK